MSLRRLCCLKPETLSARSGVRQAPRCQLRRCPYKSNKLNIVQLYCHQSHALGRNNPSGRRLSVVRNVRPEAKTRFAEFAAVGRRLWRVNIEFGPRELRRT
jgi:hypothetical protein